VWMNRALRKDEQKLSWELKQPMQNLGLA